MTNAPGGRMASPEPVAEARSGHPDLPPLRIHHLLIWITIAGLLLTVTRIEQDLWQTSNSASQLQFDIVDSAVAHIILAGFVTVSICAIYWRWRANVRYFEPGEWIAIAAAVDGLTNVAYAILQTRLFHYLDIRAFEYWATWLAMSSDFIDMAWLIIFGVLAWRARETPSWRLAYLLLSLVQLPSLALTSVIFFNVLRVHSDIVLSVHSWASGITAWSMFAAIGFAASLDHVQRRPRRWTHWLGITLLVSRVLIQEINRLWLRAIR